MSSTSNLTRTCSNLLIQLSNRARHCGLLDMEPDWVDVKGDLCNYLQVIDSGQFAISRPLANANNPGLFIEGIGKVGLPLSDRDAADLSRTSHEAPFGKGSETFVDPTV